MSDSPSRPQPDSPSLQEWRWSRIAWLLRHAAEFLPQTDADRERYGEMLGFAMEIEALSRGLPQPQPGEERRGDQEVEAAVRFGVEWCFKQDWTVDHPYQTNTAIYPREPVTMMPSGEYRPRTPICPEAFALAIEAFRGSHSVSSSPPRGHEIEKLFERLEEEVLTTSDEYVDRRSALLDAIRKTPTEEGNGR